MNEALDDFIQADEMIGDFADSFESVQTFARALSSPKFSCHDRLVTFSDEVLEDDVRDLSDLESRLATFREKKIDSLKGAVSDAINMSFSAAVLMDLRHEHQLRQGRRSVPSWQDEFSAVGVFTNAAHDFFTSHLVRHLSKSEQRSMQQSFEEVASVFVDAKQGNPPIEVQNASDQEILDEIFDASGKVCAHSINMLTEQLVIVNNNSHMIWAWERALVKKMVAEDNKPELREYLQGLRLSSEMNLAVISSAYKGLKEFYAGQWDMFDNPSKSHTRPTRYVEPQMNQVFTIPFLFR